MSAEQALEVLRAGRDVVVHCGNTTTKKIRRAGKAVRYATIGLPRNPGWEGKALYRWTMLELIDFCIVNKKDFHIGMKFITRLVRFSDVT